MKPIGYYVSVPEGHEDYEVLKVLEETNGSFFENIPLSRLRDILVECAITTPGFNVWANPRVFNLHPQTCFDLIPFLHQVIKERLVKNATN